MECLCSSCLHQARLVSCYMISRLVLRICFRLVGSNSYCFIGNGIQIIPTVSLAMGYKEYIDLSIHV
uniref:Uncharacterized protein n=1 Tax=Populus trichocarpa TaxID=3694 RepID=A0A2K1R837_POPTR